MKKKRFFTSFRLRLSIALVSLYLVAIIPATVLAGDNSLNYSEIRQVGWTNLWLAGVDGDSGHIGVDITLQNYNPCHNNTDLYYGSCIMSKDGPISYYKVENYTPTGTSFPYGIFIDNAIPNYCSGQAWCNPNATSFSHKWANRLTTAALEIYPHNSSGIYDPYTDTYGGARISVSSWQNFANGGVYSPWLGRVKLPKLTDPNVGKLNGFVYDHVALISAQGRFSIDIFQDNSTVTTTSGYPVSGFASVGNKNDGYYSSGPIYAGHYTVYLGDRATRTKYLIGLNILRPFERVDFQLDRYCFGYTGFCTQVSF